MIEGNTAGIITLVNWTLAPNGARYLYMWSPSWEILTDKMIPLDGFRSSEHWILVARIDGKIKVIIPGCQIKAWIACDVPPNTADVHCYTVGEGQ